MHVISRLKKQWRHFAARPPGRRFRDRYADRHDAHRPRAWWWKAINWGGGGLLIVVGVFLTVVPGPAVLFFAVGGLMLAGESRRTARLLDWIDVKTAPLLHWIHRRWQQLHPVTRRLAAGCMIGGSVVAIVVGVVLLR